MMGFFHFTHCVQWKNYSRWAEKHSETCRVSIQG